MTYRQFLIYLNAIGIRNDEIEKIETYIEDYSIDYEEIFKDSVLDDLRNKFTPKLIQKLKRKDKKALINLNTYCEKNKIEVITASDLTYPERLKNIENYPRVLYLKGKLDILDSVSISVVGARKHTSYGESVLNYFVDELSKLNVTIVSGMAYGVDGLAHRRSLENKNKTIAVLGNGVDKIYPMKNAKLYSDIIENGAVLSEYPVGTEPLPFRFPERNRIISGISLATIVIEAKAKSGSLITARVAAEQGKEVFSVPGNIDSLYSEGTNMLIRDGATPLLSIEDILEVIPEIKKNYVDSREEDYKAEMGDEELKVFKLISEGVADTNLIANELNEDISYISSIITILELKNIIEVEDGLKIKM
ncbi:DNA processing protein [Anaerosphaera aminiphila DSM 21120]|uniref:DNA processing protein n=1 Tax=Anaerosphaera aminiphila DSM 21120 TaxID=1120995 RepID=A0A1M5UX81_9FIRM|nr:DNA-processing protein DprA [Anaerosphaera aminiphila]SHH67506.1 DNA processing protein [Anaerosphaera aminiphila DSM 21120]